MESNAMLSWCGAGGGNNGVVGTDFSGLITLLLLNDNGIVLGDCPKTVFNEQVMQIHQSHHRSTRRADLHARADDRVEHPCRHQCHHARCRLDVHNPTRVPLLAAADLDTTLMQGMPTVMDFNFLPDMGRMTKRL